MLTVLNSQGEMPVKSGIEPHTKNHMPYSKNEYSLLESHEHSPQRCLKQLKRPLGEVGLLDQIVRPLGTLRLAL